MALPSRIYLNAYTGRQDPGSPLHPNAGRWVGRQVAESGSDLKPAPLVDLSDWTHEDVGWGVVLPENAALSPAEQATAIDAPQPIQRLVAVRGGVVLRWSTALPRDKLRRYETDGAVYDPDIVSSKHGVVRGRIPRYLLIYGPPSALPWDLQYRLGATRYVGRLDLEGDALDNYITALLDEWSTANANVKRTVVWAADHGGSDITHLMRGAIAYRIHAEFAGDADIGAGAVFLDGAQAAVTGQQLIDTLNTCRPALVVTSSHGMTGPLNDVQKMANQLGIPVDGHHALLNITDLLTQWSPDGAIWYAHACCSAGSDARTAYSGLVAAGSHAEEVLNGVAKVGAMVAPLPKALLGAQRPLRAFVGHVEPTFDWTIREPKTGQIRTSSLIDALYSRLYQPFPIGRALEECHEQGPKLDMIHKNSKAAFNLGEDRLEEALAARLVAQDLESLVILGDPTVALPSL